MLILSRARCAQGFVRCPNQPSACVVILFVRSVKIKPRLDIVAVAKTTPPLDFRKFVAASIAPTICAHEAIPNFDFLLARSAPVLKAPLQEFLIAPAANNSLDQRRVCHTEESGASCVEPGPIRGPKVVP